MSDLISRTGVSAWLSNMGYTKLADAVMDKDRFPSVNATPYDSTITLNSPTIIKATSTDLISRQDAIASVANVTMPIHLSTVLCEKLSTLPSADAVQIPIKLEKRYPQSRDEDITDAFMRGYLAGRSSADRPTGHIVTKCNGEFRPTVWAECSECGKPIDAWDKFCRHCGAKMGGDTE